VHERIRNSASALAAKLSNTKQQMLGLTPIEAKTHSIIKSLVAFEIGIKFNTRSGDSELPTVEKSATASEVHTKDNAATRYFFVDVYFLLIGATTSKVFLAYNIWGNCALLTW
jgi:hypothetical protein